MDFASALMSAKSNGFVRAIVGETTIDLSAPEKNQLPPDAAIDSRPSGGRSLGSWQQRGHSYHRVVGDRLPARAGELRNFDRGGRGRCHETVSIGGKSLESDPLIQLR